MAKLLILTADNDFSEALARALRREGHFCKTVEDEETALQEIRAPGLSLVLLDDAPALPSPRQLRNWTTLPILLATEPHRLIEMKNPLETADVLIKPVREEELLFRVRTICNLETETAARDSGAGAGAKGLILDEDRYEIRLDGDLIDLTFREFELLKHLMKNPGRVFDRENLLNLVWGIDYIGGHRTVDVHVRRIRSKIEIGGHNFIDTIRGVGYKFISESE